MAASRRSLLAAGLGAPALIGGGARNAMAQDQRRAIRAVPVAGLRVLDPIASAAEVTRNHGYLVFDTLFALDSTNTPRSQMVEAWETSGDGLTWTFQLREGLQWHDGTAVRAADCVASLRRWAAADAMGRALAAATVAMEARDARTFTLTLGRRIGFVLDALGKIDGKVPFIMPERLAATDPGTPLTEMVGCGPFRFIPGEWVPGTKAAYERFARYVPRAEPPSLAAGGKVAKVDRVEWLSLSDADALNGLQDGRLDVLERPAPGVVGHLAGAREVVVAPNDPVGRQVFVVMNQSQPPFDRLEARRALMMAVRQSEVMAAATGDRTPWRECAAVFGCAPEDGVQAEALGWPAHDLAAAQRLWRDAGHGSAPLVLRDAVDSVILHAATQQVADVLRRLGATVELRATGQASLAGRGADHGPPGAGGWSLLVAAAPVSAIANPLAHGFARQCEDAGPICDPRIGELARAWALETDPAKRRDILKQLERVHIEAATLVPLGQYRGLVAYRRSLRGLLPGPAVFYWNLEKG